LSVGLFAEENSLFLLLKINIILQD